MSKRGNRSRRASREAVRVKRPHILPFYRGIAAISGSTGARGVIFLQGICGLDGGFAACGLEQKKEKPRSPEPSPNQLKTSEVPLRINYRCESLADLSGKLRK